MDDRDVDFEERERALTFILSVIYFDGLLMRRIIRLERQAFAVVVRVALHVVRYGMILVLVAVITCFTWSSRASHEKL